MGRWAVPVSYWMAARVDLRQAGAFNGNGGWKAQSGNMCDSSRARSRRRAAPVPLLQVTGTPRSALAILCVERGKVAEMRLHERPRAKSLNP